MDDNTITSSLANTSSEPAHTDIGDILKSFLDLKLDLKLDTERHAKTQTELIHKFQRTNNENLKSFSKSVGTKYGTIQKRTVNLEHKVQDLDRKETVLDAKVGAIVSKIEQIEQSLKQKDFGSYEQLEKELGKFSIELDKIQEDVGAVKQEVEDISFSEAADTEDRSTFVVENDEHVTEEQMKLFIDAKLIEMKQKVVEILDERNKEFIAKVESLLSQKEDDIRKSGSESSISSEEETAEIIESEESEESEKSEKSGKSEKSTADLLFLHAEPESKKVSSEIGEKLNEKLTTDQEAREVFSSSSQVSQVSMPSPTFSRFRKEDREIALAHTESMELENVYSQINKQNIRFENELKTRFGSFDQQIKQMSDKLQKQDKQIQSLKQWQDRVLKVKERQHSRDFSQIDYKFTMPQAQTDECGEQLTEVKQTSSKIEPFAKTEKFDFENDKELEAETAESPANDPIMIDNEKKLNTAITNQFDRTQDTDSETSHRSEISDISDISEITQEMKFTHAIMIPQPSIQTERPEGEIESEAAEIFEEDSNGDTVLSPKTGVGTDNEKDIEMKPADLDEDYIQVDTYEIANMTSQGRAVSKDSQITPEYVESNSEREARKTVHSGELKLENISMKDSDDSGMRNSDYQDSNKDGARKSDVTAENSNEFYKAEKLDFSKSEVALEEGQDFNANENTNTDKDAKIDKFVAQIDEIETRLTDLESTRKWEYMVRYQARTQRKLTQNTIDTQMRQRERRIVEFMSQRMDVALQDNTRKFMRELQYKDNQIEELNTRLEKVFEILHQQSKILEILGNRSSESE